MENPPSKPDWDRLFATAGAQDGYFTTRQAASAGYSSQLLLEHVRAGRIARAQRGIYRLVHFPAREHEELVTAWLWSDQAGVMSHQTALALHGLSDTLPAHIRLTLPSAWRRRRCRVPAGVVLYHADVPPEDRAWFGAVPTTSPRHSLNDCARAGLSPDLLRQGAQQALRRGLSRRPNSAMSRRRSGPSADSSYADSHALLPRSVHAGTSPEPIDATCQSDVAQQRQPSHSEESSA